MPFFGIFWNFYANLSSGFLLCASFEGSRNDAPPLLLSSPLDVDRPPLSSSVVQSKGGALFPLNKSNFKFPLLHSLPLLANFVLRGGVVLLWNKILVEGGSIDGAEIFVLLCRRRVFGHCCLIKIDQNITHTHTHTHSYAPIMRDHHHHHYHHGRTIRYEVTGRVAHSRVLPLLPKDWIDVEEQQENERGNQPTMTPPNFLWENAPRHATKAYRDAVQVYSHLPNGSNILDSKWVLGRLFAPSSEPTDITGNDKENLDGGSHFAALETHCFRGLDGFQAFGCQVGLFDMTSQRKDKDKSGNEQNQTFYDILTDDPSAVINSLPDPPDNLWVVKDDMSNGAGGIWVVGPENAHHFISPKTPLYPEHRYVAQRYAWPPVLFGGRKCHVRVYGLMTSDGRAFVHNRCFLHVANDPFHYSSSEEQSLPQTHDEGSRARTTSPLFQDSVHITNCCANSHDPNKFAGEILADLKATEFSQVNQYHQQTIVPLARWFPSIRASVSALATRAFPFLQGGQANNGFEYLGMDFILSYRAVQGEENGLSYQPIAYLLEVNAPPSQDTATGLPHAEDLHDTVIRDLISLWVLPKIQPDLYSEHPGGWHCVHQESVDMGNTNLIVPSKAAILNKIRWTLLERKTVKQNESGSDGGERVTEISCETSESKGMQTQKGNFAIADAANAITQFARSQFPYFHHAASCSQVFFENAGGSQVPQAVIQAVTTSLMYRHRSMVGAQSKCAARLTLGRILGADTDDSSVLLGSNATSLLQTLADAYVQTGLLTRDDQIVLSTENHLANVQPWIQAAKQTGARVLWWTPCSEQRIDGYVSSQRLQDLVTGQTRIVALPHASNILGQIRDVASLARMIDEHSHGHAHVVVDGVAAAPHWFPNVDNLGVDWYVVSCHKLFGPHLGGLVGHRRRGGLQGLRSTVGSDDDLIKLFERGTINYEACAGIVGLGAYLYSLASCSFDQQETGELSSSSSGQCSYQGSQSCQDRSQTMIMHQFEPADIVHTAITSDQVQEAYRRIRIAEIPLVDSLLQRLRSSTKVHIIEWCPMKQSIDDACLCLARLPVVGLVHDNLQASILLAKCESVGIACRQSTFLCTMYLAQDFGFSHQDTNASEGGNEEGILRISLAHYNTVQEIDWLMQALESIPGWF